MWTRATLRFKRANLEAPRLYSQLRITRPPESANCRRHHIETNAKSNTALAVSASEFQKVVAVAIRFLLHYFNQAPNFTNCFQSTVKSGRGLENQSTASLEFSSNCTAVKEIFNFISVSSCNLGSQSNKSEE